MPRALVKLAFLLTLPCSLALPARAQDRADLIETAEAQREAGNYAAAAETLERARALAPQDGEVLRLLGTSLAFDDRADEAIPVLREAHRLYPEDLDIHLALARALYWSGDERSARNEIVAITAREPANAEAATLLRQIDAGEQGPRRSVVRAGVSAAQTIAHVDLTSTNRTWYETSIAAYVAPSDNLTVAGEVQRFDREIFIDTSIALRADYRPDANSDIYVTVSHTPSADFRARWSYGGGGEYRLAEHIGVRADLRYSEYQGNSIVTVNPALRLYLRKNGPSATIQMINLWEDDGTHRNGWSLRGDVPLPGDAAIFGGAATYPDTEAGITRRVKAAFLGGAMPVSERVTLRLAGEYETRKASYKRYSATLGASLRF